MKLNFLGACREVGRSAILVETNDKNVLLDCGINLGGEDREERYPYITDEVMEKLDSVVISHAHLDHSGYLPHLYARGWRGNVYTTKPTRDLMQLLLADYLFIAKENDRAEFTMQDINNLMRDIKYIDYGEKVNLSKETKITLFNAGHILGAALTKIEDSDKSLLYTGDFSYRPTNILEKAESDVGPIDALITESTYGGKKDKLPSLKKNSKKLAKEVKKTVQKGGKVIIPSFGVGRAQELMITLDNYMQSGFIPKTKGYIDGMIKKANSIHRQNVLHMKEEIPRRILMAQENPFDPQHFESPRTKDRSDVTENDEPAIILTTSGMLTGGPVVQYLKKLAGNPDNKIILVGYQVEGTPGRNLQEGSNKIELPSREEGKKTEIDIKAKVKSLHFSAHADRKQILEFISNIPKPDKIFLVHGEEEKAKTLNRKLEEKKHETYLPKQNYKYEV